MYTPSNAPSERDAPGAPAAPTAPSAPGAPSEGRAPSVRSFVRGKVSATGVVKGRPRPGSVEYEAYRAESKGSHPYPWHGLDPLAERKVELTVRVNEWELAVLEYIVGLVRSDRAREGRKPSLSAYLLEHGMRAALKRVLDQEAKAGADGK